MSRPPRERGASEALADFAGSEHAGDGYASALDAARALLAHVDAAAPLERGTLARHDDGARVPPPRVAVGAAYGPPLRDAFETVIACGDTGLDRGDVAIVAAARAAAQLDARDATVVARAVAAGRETARRLAAALTFDPAWDAGAVCARIGAVVAAACAAGLDAEAARDAIGIAATQGAGLRAASGTPAATATFAKIAPDALEAAVLARNGFTAAPASLEGRRGLAALMASAFDERAFVADLGARWISGA